MIKIRRIAFIAVLVSIASILGYLENLIPITLVPGVKLGLANIVILFSIYHFKWYEALIISLLRIVLVSLVLGSILSYTFFMSLSGGIISFVFMLILKKLNIFSIIFISIIGALTHGIGQIIIAMIVLSSKEVIYYLPFIMLLSIPTGLIVGWLVSRINKNTYIVNLMKEWIHTICMDFLISIIHLVLKNTKIMI